MKILLVDDEVELVSAMAERLQMRGYDAQWAANGEDAMKLADKTAFDVAVLDMKMPRISGLELQEKISAVSPDTKFIFLSGHGSEYDFKAGCEVSECYLIKPVRIEALIEKIESATA